jgi:hypothetical protein
MATADVMARAARRVDSFDATTISGQRAGRKVIPQVLFNALTGHQVESTENQMSGTTCQAGGITVAPDRKRPGS